MEADLTGGPVPFGVCDDGSVLAGVDTESIVASPAWPLDRNVMIEKASGAASHFGVDENETDPNDLHEAGWAVLFAPGVTESIKAALQPLIDHRRSQVDDERLLKIFDGDFVPGESASAWLTRHKASMRTVVPLQGVPYYLLIVASPSDIPFEFQYELDIFWAVGRIWFDTADEFRQYAASVVQNETAPTVPTSRQLALFATQNENDRATRLLMQQVVVPLLQGTEIQKPVGQGKRQKFKLQPFLGDHASKSALNEVLNGTIADGPPAVVFTGSHGKAVSDPAAAALPDVMGALVCQEWVRGGGPITPEQYFAAADLSPDAKVHGIIHFMFACYGAGWPQTDNFSRTAAQVKQIAPAPMVARLPQKLLAHPGGGALAVVGHIDRAWAWSFQSEDGTAQAGDFRMILNAIMSGDRIGQATDRFNTNWAALSTGIAETLEQMQVAGRVLPPDALNRLKNRWVARDDARNYIVFGDPAVRLRTEDMAVLS